MDILIDNKNLETVYGITVLDYTGALAFPAERENEIQWADKSGVDKNLENIRYDSKEFVLRCMIKAADEVTAYELADVLVSYMFEKGVFVLSLRDTVKGVRTAFICERSNTITPDINIRQQNSLYVFKLGLKDINPNALKYETAIVGNEVTINYDKGQNAVLYWGDGTREEVSNSGNYTKSDYAADGLVDVFIDIDKDITVSTPLICDFVGVPLSGLAELAVQFTDTSTGSPILWSWDFGDGEGSSEQSPLHTYKNGGTYTVTLQVFNAVSGNAIETKVDYITVSLPDFDSNIDSTELSAIVSEPFTFSLLGDPNHATYLAQGLTVTLTLNGVEDIFNLAAGLDLRTLSIVKQYTEIDAASYFKVTTKQLNGTKVNPTVLFQKGTLNMQGAGVSRLRLWAEASPMVRPYKYLLDDNALIAADVNILLETYADTINPLPPQGSIYFDISGGTSAIPTSTAAIAVKDALNNNPYQIYLDNE